MNSRVFSLKQKLKTSTMFSSNRKEKGETGRLESRKYPRKTHLKTMDFFLARLSTSFQLNFVFSIFIKWGVELEIKILLFSQRTNQSSVYDRSRAPANAQFYVNEPTGQVQNPIFSNIFHRKKFFPFSKFRIILILFIQSILWQMHIIKQVCLYEYLHHSFRPFCTHPFLFELEKPSNSLSLSR